MISVRESIASDVLIDVAAQRHPEFPNICDQLLFVYLLAGVMLLVGHDDRRRLGIVDAKGHIGLFEGVVVSFAVRVHFGCVHSVCVHFVLVQGEKDIAVTAVLCSTLNIHFHPIVAALCTGIDTDDATALVVVDVLQWFHVRWSVENNHLPVQDRGIAERQNVG